MFFLEYSPLELGDQERKTCSVKLKEGSEPSSQRSGSIFNWKFKSIWGWRCCDSCLPRCLLVATPLHNSRKLLFIVLSFFVKMEFIDSIMALQSAKVLPSSACPEMFLLLRVVQCRCKALLVQNVSFTLWVLSGGKFAKVNLAESCAETRSADCWRWSTVPQPIKMQNTIQRGGKKNKKNALNKSAKQRSCQSEPRYSESLFFKNTLYSAPWVTLMAVAPTR